jgi:hypothetical protein
MKQLAAVLMGSLSGSTTVLPDKHDYFTSFVDEMES